VRPPWIRATLLCETPEPPHPPFGFAYGFLSSVPLLPFWSCLRCYASLVSLVPALLSYVAFLPLQHPSSRFSGLYILPRDCSLTVCLDPFSISFILSVCLSHLRSPFLSPLPPHPPHSRLPSVPFVSTFPVQYTSRPAVLLFLHQYTIPGAREGTYHNHSFACGTPARHPHFNPLTLSGHPSVPLPILS